MKQGLKIGVGQNRERDGLLLVACVNIHGNVFYQKILVNASDYERSSNCVNYVRWRFHDLKLVLATHQGHHNADFPLCILLLEKSVGILIYFSKTPREMLSFIMNR